MRDYWLTKFFLESVGWLFIGGFVLAMTLALWVPKRRIAKVVAGAVVLLAAGIPLRTLYVEKQQAKAAADAYRVRLQAATALFEQRCAQAGEKIHRTIQGLRGIYLVNLRPYDPVRNPERADPAGDSATGMGYVSTFFSGTDREQASGLTDRNRLGAYGFVEAPAEDGEFIRYSDDRSTLEERLSGDKLTAVRVASRTARYGVEWANISTAEDAKYWIAGTRLRVIDLEALSI
jgi:hypothetical protein